VLEVPSAMVVTAPAEPPEPADPLPDVPAPADPPEPASPTTIVCLDSYGRQLTTSLNLGQPVALANPRSDFARVIREIADHICGDTEHVV